MEDRVYKAWMTIATILMVLAAAAPAALIGISTGQETQEQEYREPIVTYEYGECKRINYSSYSSGGMVINGIVTSGTVYTYVSDVVVDLTTGERVTVSSFSVDKDAICEGDWVKIKNTDGHRKIEEVSKEPYKGEVGESE